MRDTRRLPAALLLLAFSTSALAIEIGDPAPPLKIDTWIKGDPVDLAAGKGKQVHVIEFWATWCGPCRAAIPHLTELQKKYKHKGVTIIGISDESAATVKSFVKDKGDKMDYVVAIDKNDGTANAYMKAFNISGIPHAFIVDKSGRLVWHGHPESGMEEALDQIVAGKYDIQVARNTEKARRLKEEYFEALLMRYDAETEKARQELTEKIKEAGAGVIKYGAKAPGVLNDFSWTILTSRAIKDRDRDLPLALKAAKMAMDATDGKNASIVDTYARALFDTGSQTEAIKYQKKAIEVCKNDDEKRQLEKTLRDYERRAGTGTAKSK